jgi:Curli production assembly/transport component CsgG
MKKLVWTMLLGSLFVLLLTTAPNARGQQSKPVATPSSCQAATPAPAPGAAPAAAAPAAAQPQGRRKRVAIFDFDYATVQTTSAALFGTNVDVGRGISDLLVKCLVQDGTYSVIERQQLDKILSEQRPGESEFRRSHREDSRRRCDYCRKRDAVRQR